MPALSFAALVGALARDDVDEAAQEVQPGVARPDLLPQVAGAVARSGRARCPCRRRCPG